MTTPPTGDRLAGWFVTARHRQTGKNGEPRPWGTVHVKRLGEPTTACGLVSLGWQVFWGVRAESVLPDVCLDCREAAAQGAHVDARRCTAC